MKQTSVSAGQCKQVTLRLGYSPVNLLHISEHLFIRIPTEGFFSTSESLREH